MAGKDTSSRSDRIASLTTIYRYHWMFLRHLFDAVRNRFGAAGLSVLEQGFRRYGYYRGQSLRDRPETFAEGRDALSLIRNWDVADYALAALGSPFAVSGTPARATVTLPCVPGTEYFSTQSGGEVLKPYWQNTLTGLAEGYDGAAGVECSDIRLDPPTPWHITWTYRGESEETAPDQEIVEIVDSLAEVFAQPVRAIQLTRRTFGVMAALQMYVARALIDAFDGAGEQALRKALYTFGVERGSEMREQALAEGRPLTMQSWSDMLQQRDPAESLFVFRGEDRASAGIYQAACTYCPLAEVWSEEGGKGLALGYMYDVEVHRGLVESYHPGGVVKWQTVKTRGDTVCQFRFSIPELVTADDPAWAQAKAQDRPTQGLSDPLE